jgi:hypothetical protein
MQTTSARPTGVTILAVLGWIGGVLGILGALLLILGSAAGLDAGLFIYAILSLILALGELAFGIGAWTLKPWAWTVGVGVAAGSVILSIIAVILQWGTIGGVIVSIIISAIILYYLFTPGVKAAFGRA